MIKLKNNSGTILYQSNGARSNTWTYNQITSTAGTTNQYHSDQHGYLISLLNGDLLFISGRTASNIGCGGSFGNGYGIVVYPSNPNYHSNPKMIVVPHTQYVSPYTGTRNFYGWSQSHEISYNNGSTFNTCSSTPSQLGTFEFYVR